MQCAREDAIIFNTNHKMFCAQGRAKKKVRQNAMLRFLSLLLAFVIGFAACAGTLVLGGVYVYSSVSYGTLTEWGIAPKFPDDLLSGDGKVDLTALSVKDLIAEMQSLVGYGDDLTLNLLMERYGLVLPDGTEEYIADTWRTAPLMTLFSADGVNYILENTTVDYVYKFVPDGVLSDPAKDALKDKTFKDVIALKLGYLLEDVKLGYFLNVTYEKDDGGVYRVVYADASAPTLNELIAPLSLGAILDKVTNGGDVFGVIRDDIGECLLSELAGSALDDKLTGILEGKTVADILVKNEETGKHELSVSKLFEDVYLGTVLGYDKIKDEGGNRIGWKKGDTELGGMDKAVADISLDKLINDENYQISDAFSDLYIGDLMDYEPVYGDATAPEKITGWTKDGAAVSGMDKAVADISVRDLLDGKEITSSFDDLYIGELTDGYEKGDADPEREGKYLWYRTDADGVREKLTGVDDRLANIRLGDVLHTKNYEITDEFRDLYVGELMDYTKGEEKEPASVDGEGNPVAAKYKWTKDDGSEVTGVEARFANYLFGDVMDGKISTDDMTLSEVMDLYGKEYPAYDEEGNRMKDADGNDLYVTVWYTDETCTEKVSAVMAHLADTKIGDMSEAMDALDLGECVGYRKIGGSDKWQALSVKSDETLGEYVELRMAYGVMAAIGDLKVGDMDNDDKVTNEIKTKVSLAEAMGFTEGENHKFYKNVSRSELKNDYELIGSDYFSKESGNKLVAVSGILSVLAPKKVGDLEDDMDNIRIYEIMGWTKTVDEETGETIWTDENGEPTNGMMVAFADLTIGDFSSGSEKVDAAVRDMKLADALGYKKETDGATGKVTWRDGNGNEVGGIMAALADKKVGNLENEVNNVTVADMMSWHKGGDGNWYTDVECTVEATGIMKAFAHLTVREFSKEPDKVTAAVQTVKLYNVLSYEKEVNEETGKVTWRDSDGNEVTGVMAALADEEVGNISTRVDTLRFGEIMGWENRGTAEASDWYDKDGTRAEGLMVAFADLTIDDMTNKKVVVEHLKTVTVAQALGYDFRDGKWYVDENSDEEVTGATRAIANVPIGELDTEINNTLIGDLLGYTNKDGWWYDGETKTSPLVNKLSGTQLGETRTVLEGLTLRDVFSEEELGTGFLMLLDPETKLTDISGAATDAVRNNPIGKLLVGEPGSANIVTIDAGMQAKLNALDTYKGKAPGYWKTLTIDAFINYVVGSIDIPTT